MFFLFFFNGTATTAIYTLSLHDALPISRRMRRVDDHRQVRLVLQHRHRADVERVARRVLERRDAALARSEEHTSELQSRRDLVCRLLLEKKKKKKEHINKHVQSHTQTHI